MTTSKNALKAGPTAPEPAWRKSSYSSQDNGNCVEIAPLATQVGIRDSKDEQGPALLVHHDAWAAFVHRAKSTGLA